jgi:hypothetical protein
MDPDHSSEKTPLFSLKTLQSLSIAAVTLGSLLPAPLHAQNYSGNILTSGSFDDTEPRYVPWAGVDDKANLHGIDGKQIAVDDAGKIEVDNYGHGTASFAPGIACADLNDDGKNDLVIADTYGYFWFYPNSGTPAKPVFTQGEIMPIWLGEERITRDTEGYDNLVPRIQLVDIDGTHKFDIVAGTYEGKLFRVPNIGSSSAPNFRPTLDRDVLQINTHKQGVLWCNYLSPFMTTAFGNQNRLDLIMGEGTYSANSIYWLRDLNSSGTPAYDEDHLLKMIPGMGLEQITPVVVDWNNDGKPDILCGDRTGHLDLYINNSTDPDHPSFMPPTYVKIAGQEKFGNSITVAIADLSENKLPNLLIGKDDGTVNYAINTGKLGEPVFLIPPTPLKGVLPPTYHYVGLKQWTKTQAYGVPDELVAAVNPQTEPGFTFPEGETTKNALKFSVWPVTNTYFPDRYYPQTEDDWRQHVIACAEKFTIKLNQRYRVHFWAKADRNTELDFRWSYVWKESDKFYPPEYITKSSSIGTSWTECSVDMRIDNNVDPKVTDWDFNFDFRFVGQPTIYIDDVQIQQAL